MPRARLRFHAELNDFLPAGQRWREVSVSVADPAPVRHLIEGCGVPHTEVALVRRGGEAIALGSPVSEGDLLQVYPYFAALAVCPGLYRQDPLRGPRRFLADAHLGRVARHLRMLGFDTYWSHDDAGDARLAELAAAQGRILLSSDRRLLMRRRVSRGYFVRDGSSWRQLQGLVQRLELCAELRPFTRCTLCNGPLTAVGFAEVADRIPTRVRQMTDHYWRCRGCGQVYWKGTHWSDMRRRIAELCPGAWQGVQVEADEGGRGTKGPA